MRATWNRLGVVALLGLAACGSDDAPEARRARPVTVMALAESDPARTAALTGSVEPYREERVAFEVPGRVEFIVAVGTELIGSATDEEGRLIRRGELVARVDRQRYELRVAAIEAKQASLLKTLRAQEIESGAVASADLEAAERDVDGAKAALELARTNLDKAKSLAASGARTQQAVDDAQAQFDQAVARERQAAAARDAKIAMVELKVAQLDATRGQVAELGTSLDEANRNLDDCELRAPFDGRITELHVSRGAVVGAGTPVATLTMLDPIQVSVSVSADTDRRLRKYDNAEVIVRDPLDANAPHLSLRGTVIDKGEVADAATRAFRINLIVRNAAVSTIPKDAALEGVPVIEEILPVVRNRFRDTGDLYVSSRALREDADGRFYVMRLKVPPLSDPTPPQIGRGVVIPTEKVFVVPGKEYFTVARWYFRRLSDPGGLTDGSPVVIIPRPGLDPPAAPPDELYANGVVIGSRTWTLRPGELVSVSFGIAQLPSGFYVPMGAIRELGGKHSVFVVRDGVAHKIAVNVHESYRELWRITGDGIEPDASVIVDGVHFVRDGETVSVVGNAR